MCWWLSFNPKQEQMRLSVSYQGYLRMERIIVEESETSSASSYSRPPYFVSLTRARMGSALWHLDERRIVALVLGVDVRLLQDDTHGGRLLCVDPQQLGVRVVVPVVILGGVLKNLRRRAV